MTASLPLRQYQREAIDAVFTAWAGGMRRPTVVLPTGLGKTVTFAHLALEFIQEHDQRVMVLVHRDELADQAINKIRNVAPDLVVGKVKAQDNEIGAEVVVASVQTLARKARRDQLRGFGLIITDECHHAAADSYASIYGAFPEALNVGFTATLARGDGVGLGSVWDDVVYTKSLTWAIAKGHLSDVRGKHVRVPGLELGKVSRTRGDFQSGALGEALSESGAADIIVKSMQEHAHDRRSIVFMPTVSNATEMASALSQAGIPSASISGSTTTAERHEVYERFRKGSVQSLVNCMVLTEGFDAPWADCAVIARPTQSQPLYTQMVGRVLRPWPGKADALVLDIVGASANKLTSLIDLEPGRVKDLLEGESLAEAVERSEQILGQSSRSHGAAQSTDVDLFAQSTSMWLRTQKGVMFIPIGTGMFFIWQGIEDPDTWDVLEHTKANGKFIRHHTGLSISMAMGWAESMAEELDPSIASRSASWRKKSSPASEAQKRMAKALGIVAVDGLRKNDLSNLISIAVASRILDKKVTK